MGRRRTHILLGADEQARLQQLARSDKDQRARERARFALLAGTGAHTLDEMARKLGRQRSTLQNWLAKFRAGGLAGLLERGHPPGSVSPIGKPAIQAELKAGLRSGRWRSAADLATLGAPNQAVAQIVVLLVGETGDQGRRLAPRLSCKGAALSGEASPRTFKVRASSTRP